jgi:hypothetical protein
MILCRFFSVGELRQSLAETGVKIVDTFSGDRVGDDVELLIFLEKCANWVV